MASDSIQSSTDDDVMRDLRREADATPPLAHGEEASLLERSARGDRSSQTRLVAAKLGMVIRLAEERREQGLPVPDLVQEGSLGLVEAMRSFDMNGGAPFDAFAEQKVIEQMDSALAAEAAAVREGEQLVAAANDYERTEILLQRSLRRAPTEVEIAQKLEWTVERTRYIAEVVADARRRHDEELLAFIDPESVDIEETVDGE